MISSLQIDPSAHNLLTISSPLNFYIASGLAISIISGIGIIGLKWKPEDNHNQIDGAPQPQVSLLTDLTRQFNLNLFGICNGFGIAVFLRAMSSEAYYQYSYGKKLFNQIRIFKYNSHNFLSGLTVYCFLHTLDSLQEH